MDSSSTKFQQMNNSTNENGVEHIYISAPPSTTGLVCCGIVFAVIAIVLFIVSIRKVSGNMYVANVQDTVFSAASAVASVVCFVGVKLVKTIGKASRY